MKKLKLTELNKNERLEKDALNCIRGGSGNGIPCCCPGTARNWRRISGAVNAPIEEKFK